MSEKDIIKELKQLETAARVQEAAARRTAELASHLLRKLGSVSTPSSARKGRGGMTAEEQANLRAVIFRNRYKQ